MYINPGELNKRIKIIGNSYDRDQDGYSNNDLSASISCWAKFSRLSGTEIYRSDGDYSKVKARFLIRYRTEPIANDMLIDYAGDTYAIQYINNYGDGNEYIEIIAERLVSERGKA